MTVDDSELAMAREKLYSCVVSDILDSLGYLKQVMTPNVRPIDSDLTLVGRARTGTYMEVFDVVPDENPYEVEIRLVDDLKPGDVAVLACGGSPRIVPWGELLTTAALARGAVGCVTDGYCRDTGYIRALKFPVFRIGVLPLDTRGRGKMIEMDRLVECGGVGVRPGDIIFADRDGVVVVPQEVAGKVFQQALEKMEGENRTRDELKNGAFLMDVYDKYGIL